MSLWAARIASFAWLPRHEGDRWMVAAAFATVVASVTATALAWWAGRDSPTLPQADHEVSQRATVSGQSRVVQVGGHQGATSAADIARSGPKRVEQNVKATDNASATQVGGNQHNGLEGNEPDPAA
ncbi:hypothetical protein N7U49_23720 [Streptomyces sp. AD2-2]|nr:hypothetical protein N7U49_23720 [Streptomyces sp. AD2-2]